MKRGTLIGLIIAAIFAGFLLWSTLSAQRVDCQACVQFSGRENCAKVSGNSQVEAGVAGAGGDGGSECTRAWNSWNAGSSLMRVGASALGVDRITRVTAAMRSSSSGCDANQPATRSGRCSRVSSSFANIDAIPCGL